MGVVITAVIADGSQNIAQPAWAHLTFSSVTGSIATIDGNGDLSFGAVGGNATVQITLTVNQRIGSTIFLGYGWSGQTPVPFASHQMQGVTDNTVSGGVDTIVGSTLALYISSDNSNVATDWSAVTVTFTEGEGVAFFPAFVPIIPPPPIGADKPVPNFPPPTPPPIGTVPVGDLVGPVVAPAPVPPSVAGFPQPQFGSGSATAPSPSGYFPIFTTTFPVPTIVIDNVLLIGRPPPPQTASTENIVPDGWGPFVPPGAPTAPGSDGRLPRP